MKQSKQVRAGQERFSAGQAGTLAFILTLMLGALGGFGSLLLFDARLPLMGLPARWAQATLDLESRSASATPTLPIIVEATQLTPGSLPLATSVPTASHTPTPTALPGRALLPSSTSLPTLTPQPSVTPGSGASFVIGYSVNKRPLEVYKFGDGSFQRMIVAGIHGGSEWNTIALADELIVHLRNHPELVPDHVTLYILRALNPDGAAQSKDEYGRTNANGVDLNRNWEAGWQANWPRQGCWARLPTTAGDSPNSEPETKALARFLLEHDVSALISYHSAALGIFPAGSPPDPASASLAAALAAVSPYPYPPIDTGCLYTGTLVDWAAHHGTAAVDVELTNHTDTDIEINLRVLQVLLTWMP